MDLVRKPIFHILSAVYVSFALFLLHQPFSVTIRYICNYFAGLIANLRT